MHVCQTDPSGVRQEMVISHCNKEDYKDLPTLGALTPVPSVQEDEHFCFPYWLRIV